MKKTLLLTVVIYSNIALSAEADNFTARSLSLIDIKDQVNKTSQMYLKEAVKNANLEGSCDGGDISEKRLYNELKKYFSNHSQGELVKKILYTEEFAKNALPLKDSVYGEWTVSNGYLLGRKKAASSPLALSPLIQMGNQIIGVDKLEHMFGMGFSYFSQYYGKDKKIEKVLKTGIFKEKTFLGGNVLATGVFSYADLSANLNGMRFWNHMLLKHEDILGREHNLGPYISCTNSKWIVEEKNVLDFGNYIDASMDESINCSKFASDAGTKKFQEAIIKRNFVNEDGSGLCPVDPSKLQEMKEKYKARDINHFIINEEGTETVSYFNEF